MGMANREDALQNVSEAYMCTETEMIPFPLTTISPAVKENALATSQIAVWDVQNVAIAINATLNETGEEEILERLKSVRPDLPAPDRIFPQAMSPEQLRHHVATDPEVGRDVVARSLLKNPATLEQFKTIPKGAILTLEYHTVNQGAMTWLHDRVEGTRAFGSTEYVGGWSAVSDMLYATGGIMCRGSGSEAVQIIRQVNPDDDGYNDLYARLGSKKG